MSKRHFDDDEDTEFENYVDETDTLSCVEELTIKLGKKFLK